MASCSSRTCFATFLLAITFGTQLGALGAQSPPTPTFADNYHVEGHISLPYAELNEPFNAWYDKQSRRSRVDYYGDLYKVYQFGPNHNKGSPRSNSLHDAYGTLYKLVWVPASFQQKAEGIVERIHDVVNGFSHRHQNTNNGESAVSQTKTKLACFAVDGSVGNTISPQSVFPDLSDFSYDSTGKCPHISEQHRHKRCELWKMYTKTGAKESRYKMWVVRDEATNATIPVHFYMLGYDSLLGSHFDRYDVTYYNYGPGAASDDDFHFDTTGRNCGSMPGPGNDASAGELRSHTIVQNPIHEFVSTPHRYDHVDHEFDGFAKKHDKNYATDKHERRGWHNFLHNTRFINSKNRELKQYKLKVNRYADNNLKELSYLRGRLHSVGYNGGLDYEHKHNLKGSNAHVGLPDEWDWNIRGAVTPVKDQAICGSCWSFGTSGTVEGAYFVKTGKQVRLSQQQMVDCSWKYGNNGCDGGEDFRAYKYIMDAGGLSTEDDYGHYIGVDGKCHDNDVPKSVKISGFYNVTSGSVDALKHAVFTYGPTTIAIDASRPTFTFYSHGVYQDDNCNKTPEGADHQVLVTGYAIIDGKVVWIVKNSWSTYWGDNGYIMMSAEDNTCGSMNTPTVPIIKV